MDQRLPITVKVSPITSSAKQVTEKHVEEGSWGIGEGM